MSAKVHVLPPGYEVQPAAAHGLLHQARALFAPAEADKVVQKCAAKIVKLEAAQPQKETGRQLFFGQLSRGTAARTPSGRLSNAGRKLVMRQHAFLWKQLAPDRRRYWNRRAERQVERRQVAIAQDIEEHQGTQALAARRWSEQRLLEASWNRLSEHRFTDDEMNDFALYLRLAAVEPGPCAGTPGGSLRGVAAGVEAGS